MKACQTRQEILSFTVLTHLFSDTAGGEVRLLWVPILFQGLFLHFIQWLSNVSFIRDESRKDEIQHSVCRLTIKLHNLASLFSSENILKVEKSEFEPLQAVDETGSYILHFCTAKDYTEAYGLGVLHFRRKQ